MNEGRIIVNIKKEVVAVNSTWKVFVDGKFIGNADFERNLELSAPTGRHVIQLKVGLLKTKELEINVNDNEIIVECAYDGTLKNFYIASERGLHVSQSPETENIVESEPVMSSNDTANQVNRTNQQSSGKTVNYIRTGIIILMAICSVGYFVKSGFSGQSGNIENSYTAEIQCGENLDTIFGYNPRSDQVDIKAVEGKDGDVLVRVKILDEELQKELEEMGPNDQSWLDTDEGKKEESYFGYAPTTGSYAHVCYGNTKSIVKERIGW